MYISWRHISMQNHLYKFNIKYNQSSYIHWHLNTNVYIKSAVNDIVTNNALIISLSQLFTHPSL